MTKYTKDDEYLFIIDNIINNDEFKKMGKLKHHNTTRLNHLIKVSYYSYKITKGLKLDYKEAAVGGLLHDFYNEEICECNKVKDKLKLFSIDHPKEAVKNAKNVVRLNEKEQNIIETHMFPMNFKLPKYAESWIVNFVDKFLSLCEVSKKFSYKVAYLVNLYLLLALNSIK